MSSDGDRPANRLAASSSPYLLLHQHNPVDWYPWGEEALNKARDEDKPIFVSVGYSTCYWCHVMERESFSDDEVAALMNAGFVNIKLDREERPDLDEIYMTATQVLTGHGGWPNSVFLTPDRKPFFAGTYFPPEDRQGLPSFRNVLRSMADAWRTRRQDVESQANAVFEAIKHQLGDRPAPAEDVPGETTVHRSVTALTRSFDPEWGGFGSAPKFPTPANLLLLAEAAARSSEAGRMLETTLDMMARGGIYDQLGGGFHRYATDREWKVPHFEKMLYDNGWLLEAYATQWERTGDAQARRVVLETAAFLEREMTAPEGAFFSALDAETDGHEGAFYVWERQELLGALGDEDYGFLAPLFGFDGPPFFEGGAWVLHLPERLERQAERRRMSLGELAEQIEPLRRKLLKVRSARRRPLTDDKILTDWNGTAIGGLALAGQCLGEEPLVAQAARAAEFVLENVVDDDGTLLHVWREGTAHTPAMLADYAYLVRGLLALFNATGERRWREHAADLTRQQIERLADPAGGFFVAAESDELLVRSRDLFDGAQPAANAIAVLNLIRLGEIDPAGGWRERAERALRAFAPVIERVPEAARTLTVAVARFGGDALGEHSDPEPEPIESASVVRVRASDGGEPGRFLLEIDIEGGWHIYGEVARDARSHGSPEGVHPLAVEGRGCVLEEVRVTPRPSGDPAAHFGYAAVHGRAVGDGARPRIAVSFQACNDRSCLAPSVVEIDLPRLAGRANG